MKESKKPNKRMRYAIYTRYSSDMQNELSLEVQERICREEITDRGGAVVAVYSDGAKSGWSLERDGFIDAEVCRTWKV
jgi:site-specific DNA recombinase